MNGVYKYTTKAGDRWRIVYDGPPMIDPDTGETRRRQTQRRGFTREKDAKRALRDVLGDVDDGSYIDPDGATVAQYLTDEWLPSIKPRGATGARRHRGTVAASTWDRYRRDLNRYVIPHIGGVRLQELGPSDLDRLYDHLEREGGQGGKPLGAKTIANVHGTLGKALSDAVKRGRIRRSPADAISPPTAERSRTSRWWSVEELQAFVYHVEEDELRALWLVLCTTGARIGEVAAMTWDDLDLDEGTWRIEWTLGKVAGQWQWKVRPKSEASRRTIRLHRLVIEALRDHKRRQNEDRLLVGPAWMEGFRDHQGLARTGLVWTRADGSIITPRAIYHVFVKLTGEAGLPVIRVHDVRHSYASAALADATGWHSVKVLSQRLGHASVAITLDTYSHVLPAADEDLAATTGDLIIGNG